MMETHAVKPHKVIILGPTRPLQNIFMAIVVFMAIVESLICISTTQTIVTRQSAKNIKERILQAH